MKCSKFSEFIVTVCYLGKAKYAPGTFGSLAAFLLSTVIFALLILKLDYSSAIIILYWLLLLATIKLFFVGIFYIKKYIGNKSDHDPKEVVIDELVGQLIVIIWCLNYSVNNSILMSGNVILDKFTFFFILPFFLFRIFDIFKPFPICWIDRNIKGAWGVMLDDILAGIFAIVAQYLIVIFITS